MPQEFTAKVISGRRVTIPKEDYEELDIEEGDSVNVLMEKVTPSWKEE